MNPAPPPSTLEPPAEVARHAGLHYVSDTQPGIRRLRKRKSFVYLDADNALVNFAVINERIEPLVIPPAWEDVWICADARGHIQATGRDAKGRKQYIYHPRWREVRDQTKYDRMIVFARALGKLRRRLRRDMREPGFSKPKVVATVVRLLQVTLIRVGNEEYVRQNRSYGLTTLRSKHAKVQGETVRFQFQGKSGVKHCVDLHDRRLARIIKACQELPGQELFQYIDEAGTRHGVKSEDVNSYLQETMGEEFTAKDFRTWAGTVLAAAALREFEAVSSIKEAKRNVTRAIEQVAKRLGNTKTVCRQCYVHPAVLEAYADGSLHNAVAVLAKRSRHLSNDEAAVLAFLQARQIKPKRSKAVKS